MTEKKQANGYYNQGKELYHYESRKPVFVNLDELSEKHQELLMENPSFCILPWIHLHGWADGRTYPCCLGEYTFPIGNLREKSMEEIWNDAPMREMRSNMLSGESCKQCTRCYEQEKNGFFSMRYDNNRNFGHYITEVEKTNTDGSLPDFKIRYWDVRFSNLCNFSCRTCGPPFSSNWFNEHVKMFDRVPDVDGRPLARIEYAAGDEDSMIAQMMPHIPYVEQVYFAGGEPLIMKEHYFMLEKLIEAGRTDIRLQYNTNFSELRFKDKHVFDYWRHFRNVSVGASLDAMGARAELMRKGTDWKQVIENRRYMLEEVPHVDFYVNATISAMNILHVPDMHRQLVEQGLIKPGDFNVNVCQSPNWYRVDIFPEEFKQQVIMPKYQEFLEWLEPLDNIKRATTGYNGLLNLMNSVDNSNLLSKFISEVDKHDIARSENFWETFPELKEFKR